MNMNIEYYKIAPTGAVQTEFSLKVQRLVRAGVPEWEAMQQTARGHRGLEMLYADDAWRFAAQSGKASYLPVELRERFADEYSQFNFENSEEFSRAVNRRRAAKCKAGTHDYQALVESLSECYAEWAAS